MSFVFWSSLCISIGAFAYSYFKFPIVRKTMNDLWRIVIRPLITHMVKAVGGKQGKQSIDSKETTDGDDVDEQLQEQEEMEMKVPPSRDTTWSLQHNNNNNNSGDGDGVVDNNGTVRTTGSEISVEQGETQVALTSLADEKKSQPQEQQQVEPEPKKQRRQQKQQAIGTAPLRAKVQDLLEHEQKVVHLLNHVLPNEYKKPIEQLRQQQLRQSQSLARIPLGNTDSDDTSYGGDGDDDDEETKINATDLAVSLMERCKFLGSHHARFLDNLKSCLAELDKPNGNDSVVSASNDLGTSVLGFVNLFCSRELISYNQRYCQVIPGFHWVFLEHSMEQNAEFNTRGSTGTIMGGSLLDRQNQSFCTLVNRIDATLKQRGQTGLARSDTVNLSMLFHLPTRLLQLYARKLFDIARLAATYGNSIDGSLKTAAEKLQKLVNDKFQLLDQCFQLEKIYSIKIQLNLPNLAEDLVDEVELETKTPRFHRQGQVYRVKFSKKNSSTKNNTVDKLVGPCDAYLFDNVFVISWLGSNSKLQKKLYYITEGTRVDVFSNSEIKNGFSLRRLSGDIKVFKCMNQREQQSWLEQFKQILGSQEQEQAHQQQQLQQSVEAQLKKQTTSTTKDIQFFFAVDLESLYKNKKQWQCFQQDDDPQIIEYATEEQSGTKSLKHATLDKIIEKLTAPVVDSSFDQKSFCHAFMLTYRSFIEPEELLEMLIARYNTPPPDPTISPDDFKNYLQWTLFPMRLRIITLLQLWLSKHGYDFRVPSLSELQHYRGSKDGPQKEIIQRQKLIHKMRKFIDEIGSRGFMTSASEQLKEALESCSKRDTFSELKKKCISRQVNVLNGKHALNISLPKPRVPRKLLSVFSGLKKNISKTAQVSIVEWPSLEIARQLTLIEFMIFERIQPRECMGQAWNSKDSTNQSPNIVEMIERTNRVVNFFSMEILRFEKVKERSHALSKFIKVAAELRRMNNFNGCFEVVGALNSIAVHRLKQTWALVSPKLLAVWKDLEEFCHQKRNFRNMRQAVRSTAPPLLPYIGLMLTDLVFIDESNKSVIDGKINFYKRQRMSTVIEELQIMQRTPYAFVPVLELQNKLSNMNVVGTNKLNSLSFKLEPKKSPF